MEKKTDNYTNNTIQNELMKLKILRKIAKNLQDDNFCSVMGDEENDISNVFQLVICMRWVDDDFAAHDKFIG